MRLTRPLPKVLADWDSKPAILRSRQNWLKRHVLSNRVRVRSTILFVEKLGWAAKNGSLSWYKHMTDRTRKDLRTAILLREAQRRGIESLTWRRAWMITYSLFEMCDPRTR
jgi:hypothetical protein